MQTVQTVYKDMKISKYVTIYLVHYNTQCKSDM